GAAQNPTTPTGVREGLKLPLPSWPSEFSPQHASPPLARTAHEWPLPLSPATASAMPETLTGTLESLAVPSPSCPSLLAPQHDMLPSVCTAQTWSRPAAMRRTPLRSGTCCGTLTLSSGSPPSPSVPKAFSPQHQGTSPSVTAQVNADPTAKDVTV